MILYLSDVPALVDAKSVTSEPVGNSHYQLVVHVNAYQEIVLDPMVTLDEARAIIGAIALKVGLTGARVAEVSMSKLLGELRSS